MSDELRREVLKAISSISYSHATGTGLTQRELAIAEQTARSACEAMNASIRDEVQEVFDRFEEAGAKVSRTAQSVPRGLWRNSLGAELRVKGRVGNLTGIRIGYDVLAGDIAYAESYDEIFKTTDRLLVTLASLEDCGFELVEPEVNE